MECGGLAGPNKRIENKHYIIKSIQKHKNHTMKNKYQIIIIIIFHIKNTNKKIKI